MSIRIYFMIIIAAVATAGFAQSGKQEIKRNLIPEEGVLSSRTVAHINTPVTRKLAGQRYTFTDYDYAANNSIRPMVDWGDFDGDGETNTFVTAMTRQNTGIRTNPIYIGDPVGFLIFNNFYTTYILT